MALHLEVEFDNDICQHLAAHGWLYAPAGTTGNASGYDTPRAFRPTCWPGCRPPKRKPGKPWSSTTAPAPRPCCWTACASSSTSEARWTDSVGEGVADRNGCKRILRNCTPAPAQRRRELGAKS